jgi:hypothetical protein
MLASLRVGADEKVFRYRCGGAEVEITGVYDATDPGCHTFNKLRMTVHREMQHVDLDLSYGFMHAACLANRKGNAMIVFQQYCDGSGCHDLDNYGIVDPRSLKVLLTPNDTNRDAAAKILGRRRVPALLDHPATKCCVYCDG